MQQRSPEEQAKFVKDAIQLAETQFKVGHSKRDIENMLIEKGFDRLDAYRVSHTLFDKLSREITVGNNRNALILQMLSGAGLCLVGIILIPTGFLAVGSMISGGLLFLRSLYLLLRKEY